MESFAGHEWLTPWSRLQFVYFVAWAIRNKVTPLIFRKEGYHVIEMDPTVAVQL